MKTVGVYSVQGDVAENIAALENASLHGSVKCTAKTVISSEQIMNLDALVIPGGESTVIGGAGFEDGTLQAIKDKVSAGMPVLGVCAGMVLLSKQASDKTIGTTGQPLLGLLDMQVERNSFGRQSKSFETDIDIKALEITKMRAVFIRSPSVLATGSKVEPIAEFKGKIVAVRSGKIIATSFHPELCGDTLLYERFLETI